MKRSASWSKRKFPADCFQASSVHQVSRTSGLPALGLELPPWMSQCLSVLVYTVNVGVLVSMIM